MAVLMSTISFIGSLLFTPFLMLLLCVIFLASIGKSIGVRRLYIKILLYIFEYGRANIETAQKKNRPIEEDDLDDDETITEEQNKTENTSLKTSQNLNKPVEINGIKSNGVIPHVSSGNSLISRDDKHILIPEPATAKSDDGKASEDETKNIEGKENYVFDLSNCFDYIKSGVEAIIEDQVTSRFVAEELKNWNLLTRTNRRYEFISWKLTVIWMCGFIIRYCFLFPLRVTIFTFGILYLVGTTALIGMMKESKLKRFLSEKSFIISFRILARSVSSYTIFYNKQYKPKKGGVCVANHTTPVDVMTLSAENCFTLVFWFTFCMALLGQLPDGKYRRKIHDSVSLSCSAILAAALSPVITYHNTENRPGNGGICVANHTSPIDGILLMCDNCYSLIGQRHSGFLGIMQRAIARASPHIWFERFEVKDREAVAKRLKEHTSNKDNPPILIFPEGTCINNTSVMQFKKGSFEVGSVIYPVAMKYDPKFGDAFWNSSQYSMLQYLFMMMTSWATVCEVWYLPPMEQKENETAIEFANRVKSVIAKQGGLVDLVWDGQLKRIKPKREWRERQQEEFSKRLKGD